MHLPDPVFPPLLEGHAIKAPLRPLDHACQQAARGLLGAGDLVWSRNTARAECAIVLEPEVPLSAALQMNALTAVAIADCLGSLLPPAVAVHHRWPGTILVNGAAAGEIRLAIPDTALEEIPEWMVVGMSLRLVHERTDKEPGELPGETALGEEGAGEITRTDILQTFAPYFLSWVNTWQEDGFRPVVQSWMSRIEGDGEWPMQVAYKGEQQAVRVLGLDEEGGLLIRPVDGAAQALSLIDTVVVHGREPAR